MMAQRPLAPARVRQIPGRFALLAHRCIRAGFWPRLSHQAVLLTSFWSWWRTATGCLTTASRRSVCCCRSPWLTTSSPVMRSSKRTSSRLLATSFRCSHCPPHPCSRLQDRSTARRTWPPPTPPPFGTSSVHSLGADHAWTTAPSSRATAWPMQVSPCARWRVPWALPAAQPRNTSTRPNPPRPHRRRPSLLEPFHAAIERLLQIASHRLRRGASSASRGPGLSRGPQPLPAVFAPGTRPHNAKAHHPFCHAPRPPVPGRLGPLWCPPLWQHRAQTLLPGRG